MADYQRFISYMYLYEGEAKGRNTGFVKVEARGYYRRIEAVVRRQPLLDGLASVWAFYRDGNFCRGVLLGRMTISGGNGNFLWSSLKNTVENSSCQFEQLAGMLIWSERSDNLCVTLWDDLPFSIGLFSPEREELHAAEAEEQEVEAIADQEKESEEAVIEEEIQEAQQEEEFQEEAVEQQEELIDVAEEQQEELAEAAVEQEEELEEATAEQQEELMEEITEQEEKVQEEILEPSVQEVPMEQEEKPQGGFMEHEEAPQNVVTLQEKEAQETVLEQREASIKVTSEVDTETETGDILEQELCNTEQMEKEKLLISERKCQEQDLNIDLDQFFPSNPWEKLCGYYPKIKPFAWNKEMYCLKIKPGDLSRLPKENWIMGNNSFMLHGYYVYRYLILMQLEQGESKRYILGVPGVYGNRERFMADMFGFREFISINQKRVMQGQKGFWCVEIKV